MRSRRQVRRVGLVGVKEQKQRELSIRRRQVVLHNRDFLRKLFPLGVLEIEPAPETRRRREPASVRERSRLVPRASQEFGHRRNVFGQRRANGRD